MSEPRVHAAYVHPVNIKHWHQLTVGERLADRMAQQIGSWRFLIVQTIAVSLWIGVNITGLWLRWDPYPFVLLNLMFSVQAAYTGPILLLAGNRQAARDRATLEHDFTITQKAEKQNREILQRLDDLAKQLPR